MGKAILRKLLSWGAEFGNWLVRVINPAWVGSVGHPDQFFLDESVIHREGKASGFRVYSVCGKCGDPIEKSATICDKCSYQPKPWEQASAWKPPRN